MPNFLKKISDKMPEPVKDALVVLAYAAVTIYIAIQAYELGKQEERTNKPYYEKGWIDGVNDTVEYMTSKYPYILQERVESRRKESVESEVEKLIEKEITSEPLLRQGTSE